MHSKVTALRTAYALLLSGIFILAAVLFSACGREERNTGTLEEWMGISVEETVRNEYASQFRIEKLSGGYRRISTDNEEILIVPEGKKVPEGLPGRVTVLKQPVEKIYMASSSAMSFFQELGRLDRIAYTSTKASDWGDKTVRSLVEDDTITYVGKYNAPDYEWLITEGTDLAVENTMILHDPATREKLEQLGIPVIMERSSYEEHPMGRMEWVKVYGCILGMEDEAEKWFDDKDIKFRELNSAEKGEDVKVAYFSFSPNGYINIQAPSGYFAELIRAAGGMYAFTAEDLNADEDDSTTMHISMEQFYKLAKDADVLIYNAAIYGEIESIKKMTEEYPLMGDFKAVKDNRVYCTSGDIFQKPTAVAEIVGELKSLYRDNDEGMLFFKRVEDK